MIAVAKMATCCLLRTFVFSLLVVANAAYAQLGPQWSGTWKSDDGKTTMTISGSSIHYAVVRLNENERFETFNSIWHWTNRSDDAAGALEEAFGYAKKRVSPGDIAKRYEESLRAYRRNPIDFSVSDPDQSRRAIGVMSPGIYKVMWSYSGGDCGYDEYIIDGDKMLDVDECKYHFKIQLFNRVK